MRKKIYTPFVLSIRLITQFQVHKILTNKKKTVSSS